MINSWRHGACFRRGARDGASEACGEARAFVALVMASASKKRARPEEEAKRGPLDGRWAFVTGAGSGIGRGIAIALARAGCCVVVLNDLPSAKEAVQETAAMIQKETNCSASCRLADVSDADAISKCMDNSLFDIVVANAAWSERLPVVEHEADSVKRVVEVSQLGVVNTCKAAAVMMKNMTIQPGREARGKIVIVSSIMGNIVLSKNAAAYAMCKAGITHFGKCLAGELCDDRINVNVITPGWIETPGEYKWTPKETIAKLGPQMPWGRLGTPSDVGHTAVFLCGDGADYVTGSVLDVDGGMSVNLRLPFGATT